MAASPHTRGWTPYRLPAGPPTAGFPAHAGMDPRRPPSLCPCTWLPRTRGDGPEPPPANAPIAPASPHTRGWTRDARWNPRLTQGFPAHAGMDPHEDVPRVSVRRLPRTRGMDPWRATWITVLSRLPRTRGDGPLSSTPETASARASPHTRGWTQVQRERCIRHAGFPAHAGMDPRWSRTKGRRSRLPRTRGDGPRGAWRNRRTCTGFPAHAGMDRRGCTWRPCRRRLPRTRGDGPYTGAAGQVVAVASPHTRGWTPPCPTP